MAAALALKDAEARDERAKRGGDQSDSNVRERTLLSADDMAKRYGSREKTAEIRPLPDPSIR